MTQKIHVNCDLRHFLISGKIGKKKKGNIKQFVKKAGISAAVVQKFRLFDDFTELLFVSPADDLPVGVAAVDDAYDEHTGDGHVPDDFVNVHRYVHFIVFLRHEMILLLFAFLVFIIPIF